MWLTRGVSSRGGGVASYNGQYGYGEAPLERGTFFSLQVYEWVEVSLVEVSLVEV